MKERAKQTLLLLKEKDKAIEKIFNEFVDDIERELEIPKDIAVTLITDELVNRYQKKLILHSIFSKATLENYKEELADGEHKN